MDTSDKNTSMQFIKFALVGASNSAVYLGVYYAFLWGGNTILMTMAGQTVAWTLSVINSFAWNQKFVFHDSKEVWWRALGKTFSGYSSCFFLSALFTFVQIELLGLPAALVPMINLPIMGPLNFVMLKYWAFRKSDASSAHPLCVSPCEEAELSAEAV